MREMNKRIISGDPMDEATLPMSMRAYSLIQSRFLRKTQKNFRAPAHISTQGTIKALVILVDFQDNLSHTNKDHYKEMLFSSGTYPTGSMRDYFREVSNARLDVVGDVFGWYRMPQKYEYYVNNNFGEGPYPNNAQRLVEDAVHAASADIDFANYDSDGDGEVDAIFIVHAGIGAEETLNDTTKIWSHRSWLDNPVTLNGTKIYDYTIEAENGRIGLFCHEFVHVFNIPDEYDPGYDSAGIGDWCLMASGSWTGTNPTGSRPVHLCAWDKKMLGWVNTRNPTQNQGQASLAPVETSNEVMRIWTNGNENKEYFLMENRRKINFDSELPSEGLLIYHVDENINGNNDEEHPLIGVEQADGRKDLQDNENQGDPGDPYPGNTDNKNFDANSNPSSKSYRGNDTLIAVNNIKDVNGEISFDVKVGIGAATAKKQ